MADLSAISLIKGDLENTLVGIEILGGRPKELSCFQVIYSLGPLQMKMEPEQDWGFKSQMVAAKSEIETMMRSDKITNE